MASLIKSFDSHIKHLSCALITYGTIEFERSKIYFSMLRLLTDNCFLKVSKKTTVVVALAAVTVALLQSLSKQFFRMIRQFLSQSQPKGTVTVAPFPHCRI